MKKYIIIAINIGLLAAAVISYPFIKEKFMFMETTDNNQLSATSSVAIEVDESAGVEAEEIGLIPENKPGGSLIEIDSCDRVFTVDQEFRLSIEELKVFQESAPCHHWTMFIAAAQTLFKNSETKELATYYYYIGQIRMAVTSSVIYDQFEQNDELRGSTSLYETVSYYSQPIRAYAESDIEIFKKQRADAHKWDLLYPGTRKSQHVSDLVSEAEWQKKYQEIRRIDSEYYTSILNQYGDRFFSQAKFYGMGTMIYIEADLWEVNQSYAGVCSDRQVLADLEKYKNEYKRTAQCVEKNGRYAISLQYDDDEYYCFDSDGFLASTSLPINDVPMCGNGGS
jgi:hypothetical protein